MRLALAVSVHWTHIMAKNRRSAQSIFLFYALILTATSFYFIQLYTKTSIAYLLAINLTTIFMYGYDKFLSSRGKLRIPENILHLLALLGASPSALLAQHLFRHKISKRSFQWVFWSIVLVQGFVLWYFHDYVTIYLPFKESV